MKWISIKEGLPIQEPEGWLTYNWCLVATTREPKAISIARLTDEGWDFLEEDGLGVSMGDWIHCIEPDEITHWMPLPKPPNE